MSGASLLAFNLDAVSADTLRRICGGLSIRLLNVPGEAHSLPLGALLAGQGSASAGGPGECFDEPMIVMCGLSQAQFDGLLQSLRYSPIPRIGLKAVLTPHNISWSAARLYVELCREREEMRKRRGKG